MVHLQRGLVMSAAASTTLARRQAGPHLISAASRDREKGRMVCAEEADRVVPRAHRAARR